VAASTTAERTDLVITILLVFLPAGFAG